jgi:hypothetical protein
MQEHRNMGKKDLSGLADLRFDAALLAKVDDAAKAARGSPVAAPHGLRRPATERTRLRLGREGSPCSLPSAPISRIPESREADEQHHHPCRGFGGEQPASSHDLNGTVIGVVDACGESRRLPRGRPG